MVKKYGGLKFLDPDRDYSLWTAHPKMMYFHKKKGNNTYHVLACMEGFDFDKPPHVQEDKYGYDAWELTDDFYEMIVDYYNNNNDDELKVKCYTKDADCGSEEEDEE